MLQPRKRFTQKKGQACYHHVHSYFIHTYLHQHNHWLPGGCQVVWPSPTAPTSSWLPALPTWQVASIAIAGDDGSSRCRKGRFVGIVLDFVGNLLAIVDLGSNSKCNGVHDSQRLNQKKNWKAASKHHRHHSKSYHQGSSSRPSKHLKTAAQPELLAVDTGAVRLRAARQLGDNEQMCAMNIGTTTLGDPYTILASANVLFSP